MTYEYKPGYGSAFDEREKKTEDWHADYRGKVMLPDGQMCFLDITNKTSGTGKSYLSVKLKPMSKQPENAAPSAPPAATASAGDVPFEDDKEIPF